MLKYYWECDACGRKSAAKPDEEFPDTWRRTIAPYSGNEDQSSQETLDICPQCAKRVDAALGD